MCFREMCKRGYVECGRHTVTDLKCTKLLFDVFALFSLLLLSRYLILIILRVLYPPSSYSPHTLA